MKIASFYFFDVKYCSIFDGFVNAQGKI